MEVFGGECNFRQSSWVRRKGGVRILHVNAIAQSTKSNKITSTGKNNGFPFLDILGYLKSTHKNLKFGEVRQVPTREFPTKFPDWDLSNSSKFGIFVGTL